MTPELLRQYLSFYQDLGVDKLYLRTPMTTPLPGLAPDNDTLLKIQEDIGDCKRCRLHEGRHKIVFGDGKAHAKLVFVGEGPGKDEDIQGIPFVGRAGQLLTQMIENTASKEGIPLKRQDVYICNVVKCRPPKIAHRSLMRWKSAANSFSVSYLRSARKRSVHLERPPPKPC